MDSKRKVCSLDIWPVSMFKDTFIVWSEAPFVLTWPLPGFWMAGAPCRKKCDSVPCFQALNWKNISFCQDSPLTSSLNDCSWMMSSSWDRWGWNETILTTFVSLQPFQVMGKDMNPLPVSVSYQLPLQPPILKPGYACYPFLGCRADTMHLFLQVDIQPSGCEHWVFSMNIKSSPGFQKWKSFPLLRHLASKSGCLCHGHSLWSHGYDELRATADRDLCLPCPHHLQEGGESCELRRAFYKKLQCSFFFPWWLKPGNRTFFKEKKKKSINQDEQMPNFCSPNGGIKW